MTTRHEVYPGTDLGRRVEDYADRNDLSVSEVYTSAVEDHLDSADE